MWNEISAHLYKQVKIAKKWPGEAAHVFVYPLISILSLGIMAFFVVTRGAPVETFLFVFVGVVVWNVYEMAQRTMAYGVMEDIFNNCLKYSFVGNSAMKHFIIGNAIYGILGALTGLFLAIAAGLFLFGFNLLSGGWFLAANLTAVFIFGGGMGLLLSSMLFIRGAKYMALIWITPGIIMLLSGIYYPVEILPPVIKEFSLILPSTHSIASLRAALFGAEAIALSEFGTGALMSVISFVIGGLMFRLGMKKGNENGTITKY